VCDLQEVIARPYIVLGTRLYKNPSQIRVQESYLNTIRIVSFCFDFFLFRLVLLLYE
jgi:hypothetical protein